MAKDDEGMRRKEATTAALSSSFQKFLAAMTAALPRSVGEQCDVGGFDEDPLQEASKDFIEDSSESVPKTIILIPVCLKHYFRQML